jgi:hypothetical protein
MSAPPLAALIFSVLELENAMKHLRRSNEELREALAETPDDQDFIDAIAVSARQRRLDTPLRWLAPAGPSATLRAPLLFFFFLPLTNSCS